MRRLVVVSAGTSVPSSTRLLADRVVGVVGRVSKGMGVTLEVSIVELRPLASGLVNMLLSGVPSGPVDAALSQVREADLLVALTPVYNASYSGLFKLFFDLLEEGSLRGVPVLLGATGGTPRHSLVVEHLMRPLLGHMGARPVQTSLFVATEDWMSTDGSLLDERLERAATELLEMPSPTRTHWASTIGPLRVP